MSFGKKGKGAGVVMVKFRACMLKGSEVLALVLNTAVRVQFSFLCSAFP
jgi:hypothetical protein